MRAAGLLVLLLLAAALVAASFPTDQSAARVPPFKKVAVLFLENHGYDRIVGSRKAPYLNRLASAPSSPAPPRATAARSRTRPGRRRRSGRP
jgi:hypothetical protein